MPNQQRISHVVGFDDGPFDREHRGNVMLIGTVFAGVRLEGVLRDWVRKDGANSTTTIARLVAGSKFHRHLQAVLLQGIAFAGFNVVDIHRLNKVLGLPVIVVIRKRPNMVAVRRALHKVAGGARKLRLIERAGPVESATRVFLQRAGIGALDAAGLVDRLAINSNLPEPLRTAHMVAAGVVTGESRHRP